VTERTPFPEIPRGDASAQEWLGRFMEAQASLAGNALFLAFTLGQLGAVVRYDKPQALEMLDNLKVDRLDLQFSAEQLDRVLADLIANIERNLMEP
jgi:hypothetical protein